MIWRKLGRLITEHAAYPTVDRVDGKLRIYFSRRNELGQSYINYLTVNLDQPLQVDEIRFEPLLEPGRRGTFDADGHAARSVVETDRGKLMYLIGWNRSHSVPYHLSIGCARSDDGRTWTKLAGPVLDRSIDEPFLCTSPCVIRDGDYFRMWYCGGLGWEEHDGRWEPLYRIHHAESRDGLAWRRTPHVCIDTFPTGDAIGWPLVWREGAVYHMIFSYRGRAAFRDDPAHGYRPGYAVSTDGLTWELRNDEVGLERSVDDWDSTTIAYTTIYNDYLFYNGNGFGATGIGVARRA